MSGAQEILLRSAVVETFCQVRGVDVVAFLVGDEPLTDQDGQVIGAMGPEDFVKNTVHRCMPIRKRRSGFILQEKTGKAGAGDGKSPAQY